MTHWHPAVLIAAIGLGGHAVRARCSVGKAANGSACLAGVLFVAGRDRKVFNVGLQAGSGRQVLQIQET